MTGPVVLDVASLKALAAKPRLDILAYLAKRRHTATEMAKHMRVSLPTVKEHLQSLEKAKLIVKHDEGHKWKYYSLTQKGRAVLEPRERSFSIVWVAALVSAVGLGYSAVNMFSRARAFAPSAPQAESADLVMHVGRETVVASGTISPVVLVVLFTLIIASLLWYLFRR